MLIQVDPNANLLEQERTFNAGGDLARRRELRAALCQWLDSGGYAPDWSEAPRARVYFKLHYGHSHGA